MLTSPSCVHDYNKNVGPVDGSNQMRQAYGIDRKSKRWWIRLFLFMLDVTTVNSFIIYKRWFERLHPPHPPPQQSQDPLSHLLFRTFVIDGLVGKFTCRHVTGPTPGPTPPSQRYGRRQGHESVNWCSLESCPVDVTSTAVLVSESSFGRVACNVRLCRNGRHDKYHQRPFAV